jgi:hypothetical protein
VLDKERFLPDIVADKAHSGLAKGTSAAAAAAVVH